MKEVSKKFNLHDKGIKFYRSTKGITLVALVITIVILIILAVVSINAIFGESGLIRYAQDSERYQANAEASDSKLLNDATEYIDGIIGGGSSEGDIPSTPIEVEQAKESGDTFEDTTIIKDDLDNDVTIPGGFHVAEDSGTKIEEGIVIEDDIGNQFVWIPTGTYQTTDAVETTKTNNLIRRDFKDSEVEEITENNGDGEIKVNFRDLETYYYGEGDSRSCTISNGINSIDTFKNSATTNKGFYIGRYESGTEEERKSNSDSFTIPLVQANKNAYVYITRNQAKVQAEEMYKGNEYITSELISSYAWDTALNFICQNNEEGYMLAITKDNAYGNIGTGNKELTGVYEADSYCNIYDILGNCREWSTEYSSSTPSITGGPCVARGGYYNDDIRYNAAYRSDINEEYSDADNTFRIVLYIK